MWKLTEDERKIFYKIIPTDFLSGRTRLPTDESTANGPRVKELITVR